MPRRSRWMLAVAGVYALGLAVVGLWPSHVDRNVDVMAWAPAQWVIDQLGLTTEQGYNLVEFGANVLWFVPFGMLLRVLRPTWSWVVVVLAGAGVATVVEVLQAVARPGRTASVSDVVANTLGVALGCLVWAALRRGSRS